MFKVPSLKEIFFSTVKHSACTYFFSRPSNKWDKWDPSHEYC